MNDERYWKKSLVFSTPTLIRSKHQSKNNLDKYISPRILGRLGNQMFEIATAYSLAADNNSNVVVSLKNGIYNSVDGEYSPPTNYDKNIFRHIKFVENIENYDTWNEKTFRYEPITYDFSKNLVLNGYFQSEKYFKHNRDIILNLFKPTDQIKDYIEKKYGKLLKKSVSVHIRRGDRLKLTEIMPLCSLDYYKRALLQFPDVENILIVTDDKEWAKKVFMGDKFHVIENETDYVDFYIMSMCDNNIIANSTFSWWAAWLNKNKDKMVVAPRQWYNEEVEHDINELIPKGWLML